MGRNKAAGTDNLHVKMFKSNSAKVANTLSLCWKAVGKTKMVPLEWTVGTIVPHFKGKGTMGDPVNYRPLCILSHARKIVEKAVVMELESLVSTDRAQLGFQDGIQIEQAALRVAALIRSGIKYVLVLDLSKAFYTVLKSLLIEKLKKLIPKNLLSQLKVFISTVVARVAGDISNTVIPMRRGLTQGGISSAPLFRIFISDVPEELRKTIRENFPNSVLEDPELLVADDVIAFSVTLEEMQCKK